MSEEMGSLLGAIIGLYLPAIIVLTNLGLGAYLLNQRRISPRQNRSRESWSGLWVYGWIFFLLGSPAIFLLFSGMALFIPYFYLLGVLLMLVSTVLYAIAAQRCSKVLPDPPLSMEPSEPSGTVWPPPPHRPEN